MTRSRETQSQLQTFPSALRRIVRPALAALALALLIAPLTLAAGHGHGRHGGPGMDHGGHGFGGHDFGRMLEHLADRLELTEEQRDEARQVWEARSDDLEASRQALRQQHQALRDAAKAEPFDEAAIRAAGDALGDAAADMAVLRAELHEELIAILTPEQQAELDALHAEREQRREERRQRRQERRERFQGSE